MHARKWLSNSAEVLKHIPASDCISSIDLDRDQLPVVKTLGVLWDSKQDEFHFCVNPPNEDYTITKRSFLQNIATLYDPLGFLTPFTVRAKILMQEMWASGCDWDESPSDNLTRSASQWFTELTRLTDIRVSRCLKSPLQIQDTTLHVFVDASQEAYGAVAYLRHEYEDGSVTCRFIAAKSRVAPLNAVSIPRIELMAAVIGVRLAKVIGQILDIPSNHWCLWSDSMDVLHWVRGHSRSFKPFVAHRVGEIQDTTNPAQWRHVPTAENPADLLSRGESVTKLAAETKWWNGPGYLLKPVSDWPQTNMTACMDRTRNSANRARNRQHLSPSQTQQKTDLIRLVFQIGKN